MDAQQPPDPGAGEGHPDILENPNPFSGPFNTAILFIQSYGWLIALAIVICFYLKSKLGPTITQYRQRVAETIENKKFDPEKVSAREAAREAARQRMQEQLDAQAARHAEQMKQKEEEKRKQKIEDWDGHLQGKGYRSKHKVADEPSTSTSKPVKPKEKSKLRQNDFNPLMGESGGANCSWRPGARRGGGGGGG